MKNVVAEVRHKSNVVGNVNVPVYENIDELRANVSDAEIVKLFNKMNKIEIQAAERNKHSTEKGGKKLRKETAFAIAASDDTLRQRLQQCVTIEQLDAFLFSDELQALVDAKLGTAAAA